MANIYYQEDCNLAALDGKTIAVIGYGSQGHAHALNAKESGCNVIMDYTKEANLGQKLKHRDLKFIQLQKLQKKADIIMILINDEKQQALYQRIHRTKSGRRQYVNVRSRLQHPLWSDQSSKRS